ncbi:MAG: hypothetical protein ACI97A_003738 [Planctomycetota bacterium]|jgi:hypothetical protein
MDSIESSLRDRFAQLKTLDQVWIDPALKDCPLPSQQRSPSKASIAVARGTKILIGNKSTLRFFIYWVGRDIDLSATFHDDRFQMIDNVSYTTLQNKKLKAYHSGDITDAEDGACEFIDVDMNAAIKSKIRHVAMNVLVYSGPSFKEHDVCHVGWMTRANPKSR